VQLLVDSTDPIPQFEVKPTNEWLYPSRFTLDASLSSDVDVTNGFDQLTYERLFPEELKANIIDSQNNNETIVAEFNGVGKYAIKLVVKDKYGKMAEIEKELEIKSTVRPEIDIAPVATFRGNPINFVVRSNEAIINYQWDFGDGTTSSLQVANVSHAYKKTGVYKVKLAVESANGNSNEVTRLVFIGEKDYPVAGFVVNDKLGLVLTQNETCTDADGTEIAAYQIDRYADFKINPSLSVNSK
jgi:PKD repeat protein